MTIAHVVHSFVSVPVAIVGTVGTMFALAFDPTIAAAAMVTVIVALTAGIVAILTKLGDNKIQLAKIATSVDGVASRQVDKVAKLEERVADLLAQLAAAQNTASTLAATHAAVAVAAAAGAPPTDLKDK